MFILLVGMYLTNWQLFCKFFWNFPLHPFRHKFPVYLVQSIAWQETSNNRKMFWRASLRKFFSMTDISDFSFTSLRIKIFLTLLANEGHARNKEPQNINAEKTCITFLCLATRGRGRGSLKWKWIFLRKMGSGRNLL